MEINYAKVNTIELSFSVDGKFATRLDFLLKSIMKAKAVEMLSSLHSVEATKTFLSPNLPGSPE